MFSLTYCMIRVYRDKKMDKMEVVFNFFCVETTTTKTTTTTIKLLLSTVPCLYFRFLQEHILYEHMRLRLIYLETINGSI